MEISEIIAKLEAIQTPQEKPQSQEVKELALFTLSHMSGVQQLLHDLLTKVVKPLFSKQQHPHLTSTGRKKLVSDTPVAARLGDTIDWDDESKIWKNGWTTDLLLFCLSSYPALGVSQEKSTFESQFHLLVPPILNLIDDGDIEYKTHGCRLLHHLCDEVTRCESDILKRTGLSNVFSDALRTNFMHLPTLTPEDESVQLLSELYPAFRTLITATFVDYRQEPTDNKDATMLTLRPASQKASHTTAVNTSVRKANSRSTVIKGLPDTKERDARQSLLDLILRHGILAAYAHASDYVRITTLLLHEAAATIAMMGIYSAKYLQVLIPLLRGVLCNPFGTAHVPLLLHAMECLEVLVNHCWPRIRDKWWGECLRGIVGCWVQLGDDEGIHGKEIAKVQAVEEVKRKLQEICRLLAEIVGVDFEAAGKQLAIQQEGSRLDELFATNISSTKQVS